MSALYVSCNRSRSRRRGCYDINHCDVKAASVNGSTTNDSMLQQADRHFKKLMQLVIDIPES